MIIYRYNTDEMDLETAKGIFDYLEQALPEEQIIFIPSNIDLMFNCNLDELKRYANRLNEIIEQREKNIN